MGVGPPWALGCSLFGVFGCGPGMALTPPPGRPFRCSMQSSTSSLPSLRCSQTPAMGLPLPVAASLRGNPVGRSLLCTNVKTS